LYNHGNFQDTLVQGEALAKQFPAVPIIPSLIGAANSALGRQEQAVASYKKALQIKPDFAEAHNNLGAALNDLGKPEDAISSLTKALRIKPDFAVAHNNLGNTLKNLGKPEEALASFSRALQIKPDYAEAHNNLGNALNELGKPEDAVASYYKALQINPEVAATQNNLGNALHALGKLEEAVACFEKALQIKPDFAEAHNNLGNALNDLGMREEAVACFDKALHIEPAFAGAHRNLSSARKYRDDDPQIQQMLQLVERHDLSDEDLMQLNFALGKAYGDIGDHDIAFSYLLHGNRLLKQERKYETPFAQASFTKIQSWFSKDVPALKIVDESQDEIGQQPIFILGMPRSGTTLVEQILASHSQVYGAGELKLLEQSIKTAEYNSSQLSHVLLQSVRKSYLSGLAEIAASEPYVTDKMPLNFRWIGFICAAFPEAKIVHVIRDARATCWSIFKHYFSRKGHGFANDLQDVVEYYKLYVDMMAFWHEQFPGRIYDLNYEALTEHQADETRKLIEHVGLDWEDQCLEFHKTKRAVQTSSVTQVRQKMYQGSSEEWRKYEDHLGPMVESLSSF
jgi:tetratricopeptide (TPR) repeat protein